MKKDKAIIFDMDGLLIDSEPLWREVETAVFRSVGVPFMPEMTLQTMGLRCDEATAYWFTRYPWDGKSPDDVTREIIAGVAAAVREKGAPMPGVHHACAIVQRMGYASAVASSSPDAIINAMVERLYLDGLDVLYSAEHEQRGKPAPDVYLGAARLLGVSPEHCLAFEDSKKGIQSAKSAGMKCIAVVDPRYSTPDDVASADRVLRSLEEVTEEMIEGFLK
ncbi:MAG: hexitol phosphatase HxpB [Patescibacteria group bacterium]